MIDRARDAFSSNLISESNPEIRQLELSRLLARLVVPESTIELVSGCDRHDLILTRFLLILYNDVRGGSVAERDVSALPVHGALQ